LQQEDIQSAHITLFCVTTLRCKTFDHNFTSSRACLLQLIHSKCEKFNFRSDSR